VVIDCNYTFAQQRALGQQVSSEEELEDEAGNFFAGSIGGGEPENEDPRGVHKIANYLQIFRFVFFFFSFPFY
jgi:hypothetical protein